MDRACTVSSLVYASESWEPRAQRDDELNQVMGTWSGGAFAAFAETSRGPVDCVEAAAMRLSVQCFLSRLLKRKPAANCHSIALDWPGR
jgi:hypothetical protein